MTLQPSVLFIFGIGYTGAQLGLHLVKAGWQVNGTVRSAAKAEALIAARIGAQIWPGTNLNIPAGAHWLISVPPDAGLCPVARVFGAHAPQAASITYLSTTGVYGDLGGGWAFEWSPVSPASPRAVARVAAEDQWRRAAGDRLRIVRLPGIYGPGRSAFDRMREAPATMPVKPGQVFSRVHVEDLVDGLVRLLEHPEQRGVFHFCDDEPAPPEAVIAEAARLLGHDSPRPVPVDEASLSEMARSFYAECKRVSNARAKAALDWRPRFSTYREGLAAIRAQSNRQSEREA